MFADFEVYSDKIYTAVSKHTMITYNHKPLSSCIYIDVDNSLPEVIRKNLPRDQYLYRGKGTSSIFISYLNILTNYICKLIIIYEPIGANNNNGRKTYIETHHKLWVL